MELSSYIADVAGLVVLQQLSEQVRECHQQADDAKARVVIVGAAFSTACFLERLSRDHMRTDTQPNAEVSHIAGGLPKWLCRNKQYLGVKDRGKREERREGLWCWLPP